jgi:ubiquinone/menaquinone biosynthesis C-methylase UbiE
MHDRRFHRGVEYLRTPERVARLEVQRVVNLVMAGLTHPQNMLDIGTGSGIFAEAFAAQGLKVAGVDVNPEMLPVAQQYVPSGTFKEAGAEKLPFQNAEFDLVIMGLVLHETDEPGRALWEARRVTSQRVAVLEWPDVDQQVGPPQADRLSTEQISTMVREIGFKKFNSIRLETLALYIMDC